jgi:tRNA(adenine34) deaminase
MTLRFQKNTKEYFMSLALKEARKAAKKGEVPVGAVIVKDGAVVARGHNQKETKKNALRHAEITAISSACRKLGGWRLFGCEMYVTLEPCPMCAGAIVNARLDKVTIGARDEKTGAFGSLFDLLSYKVNHKPRIEFGVLSELCEKELKDFFLSLRLSKNQE